MRYVDAHVHLHEFDRESAARFAEKFILIAVSDDYESSLKTLELAQAFKIHPCVGIHPWEAHKVSDEEVGRTLKLLERGEVVFIGEVGLDKKFIPKTFERQLEIFRKFLKAAEELSLLVNLHAAGAWKEVLEELERHNIERAIFHWYTGPLSILEKIDEKGYKITVKPAVKIQNKMRKIVKEAPLSVILTESDGPYNYRGINLTPEIIPDTVKTIAQIKGLDQNTVAEKIHQNANKILDKK